MSLPPYELFGGFPNQPEQLLWEESVREKMRRNISHARQVVEAIEVVGWNEAIELLIPGNSYTYPFLSLYSNMPPGIYTNRDGTGGRAVVDDEAQELRERLWVVRRAWYEETED